MCVTFTEDFRMSSILSCLSFFLCWWLKPELCMLNIHTTRSYSPWVFQMRSYYVAYSDPEPTVLLPPPSQCQHYRHGPRCTTVQYFVKGPFTICFFIEVLVQIFEKGQVGAQKNELWALRLPVKYCKWAFRCFVSCFN